jgi:hypothetical protein
LEFGYVDVESKYFTRAEEVRRKEDKMSCRRSRERKYGRKN